MSSNSNKTSLSDRFKTYLRRVCRVGKWDNKNEARVFIGFTVSIVSLIIDALVYVFFCILSEWSPFLFFTQMDRIQLALFLFCILHFIANSLVISGILVEIYDYTILKPVKSLIMQMRNINRGEMTDYLLSGKLSKPFATIGREETWVDMVQSYVDTAASEKYLDELTGCFNRKYFSQVLVNYMKTQFLAHPIPRGPKTYSLDVFAVFLIDIDHFKQVNDDFGHAAGDEVLRQVGSTLRRLLGDVGVVIRNGGEEFLIISSAKFPYDFSHTAHMINQAFRDNISIHSDVTGETRKITCSVGYVYYPLYDSTELLSLQNHVDLADQAMYLSKINGRDTWRELVANKRPPVGFDLNKFCNDPDYGVKKDYLTIRKPN